MWVYGLLIVFVFILLLLSVIYLVKLTYKVVSKKINNKLLSWILSCFPLLFFGIGLYIDLVNAIVVDIHLIVIIFIIKQFFKLIKKYTNKEINEFVILGIGIIISTIVLFRGYYLAHNVSETNYVIYTTKDIGTDDFKIVQISDSHIGTTMDGKKFTNYMNDINKLNPDIVVITGDFIDDNTIDMDIVEASSGLGKLKTKYGVYFVYGNHDKGYYNINKGIRLKEELEKNNVTILQDEIVNITDNIILVGRCDRSLIHRLDANTLTRDLDKNKYIIMLDHQPNDYENEKNSGVDLVLSGHTHGGQLYPLGFFGVLFGSNDKVYGIETRDNTTFIVNSGIGDWAIKFKTDTKSEYGVIDIKVKKSG